MWKPFKEMVFMLDHSGAEAGGGGPNSTEVAYQCLETGKSGVRKNKVSVRAPSQDGGDKLTRYPPLPKPRGGCRWEG